MITGRLNAVSQLVHALRVPHEAAAIAAIMRDGEMDERMATWALQSTLAAYRHDALEALDARAYGGEHVAILLAETVPVAPLRAIVLPFLGSAAEITVRPAARSAAFTRLIVRVLRHWHGSPTIGIAEVPSGAEFVATLAERGMNRLIAFGSDDTLAAIATNAPPGVTVEGRGHGFGIVILSEHGAVDPSNALALARDVAAYEQRGCLSPQCVFVHAADARPTADALHRALGTIAETWPAPPIPGDTSVALHSWLGAIGALAHTVYRGASTEDESSRRAGLAAVDHAVAALDATQLVSSPGHRRIAVVPFADPGVLERVLERVAQHITVVASDPDAPSIALPMHARRARLGEMQIPPLDGWEDRRPPTITRR